MKKKEYFIQGAIPLTIIPEILKNHTNEKNTGAYSIFFGQVRNDIISEKKVLKIVYSAYDEMAIKEIESIENKIFKKYEDVKNIYIKHSKGEVAAGEISFLVIVSGGHRIQARKACAETVDLFKKNVPFWKKEILEDNSHNWR